MNALPKRTRPRGFAPWNPRPESLALVRDVRGVLDEYRAHLPLTLRQAFYRLVTRGFPKDEAAYARLCETVNRARRAGLLPFEDIRDDGGARYEAATWTDPADFLGDVLADAQRFRLDRQEGQPVRLWLLAEAAGMLPMVARVANPHGVPALSAGGFDSLTAKHSLAREIAGALRHHEQAEILHIGDMDPSGEHIFASLAEDVGAKAGLEDGDKLALGGTAGGAVRLTDAPGPLLVGEGIESTLAALTLHGDATARAWAALSTSGLRGLRLPPQAGRLCIAPDGDAPGIGAAHALAERAHALGWQVTIAQPPAGADWADILTGKAVAA